MQGHPAINHSLIKYQIPFTPPPNERPAVSKFQSYSESVGYRHNDLSVYFFFACFSLID